MAIFNPFQVIFIHCKSRIATVIARLVVGEDGNDEFSLDRVKYLNNDTIHNFKWVKIIQFWQNGGQRNFEILMSRFIFNMFKSWCLMSQ